MTSNLETLVLLMARARIMQRALAREQRLLNRRVGGHIPTLVEGWPAMTYFQLYLASLQVLVEAWDASLLYDEQVHELLRKNHRATLRRFRNAVFHPHPFQDKRLMAVYRRHRSIRAWADAVLDGIAHCIKVELNAKHVATLRGVPALQRR